MFVNEDYSNYKYLVSVSDNYVVLTNRHSVSADWQNPQNINVIYQYFKPSFVTIESTRTVNSSVVYEQVDISDSFYSRADCIDIIFAQFLVIFFVAFIFNGLTRFVKKGGALFGS